MSAKNSNGWNNHADENSIDKINQKIGLTENKSLASTQRALKMINDAEDIGINTTRVFFFKSIKIHKLVIFSFFFLNYLL